jgi:hypothetical protein
MLHSQPTPGRKTASDVQREFGQQSVRTASSTGQECPGIVRWNRYPGSIWSRRAVHSVCPRRGAGRVSGDTKVYPWPKRSQRSTNGGNDGLFATVVPNYRRACQRVRPIQLLWQQFHRIQVDGSATGRAALAGLPGGIALPIRLRRRSRGFPEGCCNWLSQWNVNWFTTCRKCHVGRFRPGVQLGDQSRCE